MYNDTSGGSFNISLAQLSSNTQLLQLYIEVIDSTGLELGQSYELGVSCTQTRINFSFAITNGNDSPTMQRGN